MNGRKIDGRAANGAVAGGRDRPAPGAGGKPMNGFVQQFTTQPAPAVAAAVGASVVLVVFILSVLYYQVRSLAEETALRREKQQADIAIKQDLLRRNLTAADLKLALELLGVADGPAADELRAGVVSTLLSCWDDTVAPGLVEEAVTLIAAADRGALLTLQRVLDDVVDHGSVGPSAFAAVVSMCRPVRRADAPAAKPVDLPDDIAVR